MWTDLKMVSTNRAGLEKIVQEKIVGLLIVATAVKSPRRVTTPVPATAAATVAATVVATVAATVSCKKQVEILFDNKKHLQKKEQAAPLRERHLTIDTGVR